MPPLSKTCAHGLRACMLLAGRGPGGRFVTTRSLAEELRLPGYFLAKVMKRLAAAGLVRSQRGPGGGVALARPAGELTLADLLSALNGLGAFPDCLLGLPECGTPVPCPLRARWSAQRESFRRLFADTTLKDWMMRGKLAGEMKTRRSDG